MIGLALRQEIEHAFEVVRHKCTNEELVFVCPECDDRSGHRSVNLNTGVTFCFRCNKGQNNKGFFLAWAKALGYAFANETELSTVPLRDLLAPTPPRSIIPVVVKIKMPKGFSPITAEPDSVYTKLITKMAVRKNLDYDAFAEAGVGFTRYVPRWEPFAIFPVQEYKMDVYYQGRTYVDVPGESTKLFPSKAEVKYGAAFYVYNIDELRQPGVEIAVVVESVLNVLSLRRKFRQLGWTSLVPVCVFKHHVSNAQLIKIMRCRGLQEVCLLFDHDAIDTTWHSIGSLNNKISMTVAEMPLLDGNKKLDPNDNVDAAIEAIENRRRYDYMAVLGQELEKGSRLVRRKSLLDMQPYRFG